MSNFGEALVKKEGMPLGYSKVPYQHYTYKELRQLIYSEPTNIYALYEWFTRTQYVREQTAREAARAAS
jgi:nicotinamide riboside transporter PnuC